VNVLTVVEQSWGHHLQLIKFWCWSRFGRGSQISFYFRQHWEMGILYDILSLTRGWHCSSLGRVCTRWVLLLLLHHLILPRQTCSQRTEQRVSLLLLLLPVWINSPLTKSNYFLCEVFWLWSLNWPACMWLGLAVTAACSHHVFVTYHRAVLGNIWSSRYSMVCFMLILTVVQEGKS